jgi:lipopolysaccharide export system protein LptA
MRLWKILALAGPMLTAAVLTAAAAPAPTASLGLDASQPIAVNADAFLADLNKETGTYTGNVIVTQGGVRLHADEVTVHAPGGRASRMEANGNVVVDSPSGQAVGDSGVYDVPQQLIRLTGNVVLTKDANVMRGNVLEVSMATGLARLTADSAAAAPGQPRGRVQGLFVPAPGAGNAAPQASENPGTPGTK